MTPDPNDQTPNLEPPNVETGTRRAETHYEADADQQVRVAHLAKPEGPLPREDGTTPGGTQADKPGQPVADVRVDTAESSVWDARPPEDRAFQDVPAGGAPLTEADGARDVGAGDWAPGYLADDAETLNPDPDFGQAAKPPFPPAELVSKRAG
jgi:hypothetical protein